MTSLALFIPCICLTPLFTGADLFSLLPHNFLNSTWNIDITCGSLVSLSLTVLPFSFNSDFLTYRCFYLLSLVMCPSHFICSYYCLLVNGIYFLTSTLSHSAHLYHMPLVFSTVSQYLWTMTYGEIYFSFGGIV